MKDELGRNIMKKLIALLAVTYIYLTKNSNQEKKENDLKFYKHNIKIITKISHKFLVTYTKY